MKGRMTALYKSLSGKQVLTVELDGDISGVYKDLSNADVDVEIKKFRHKRSMDANAYAWVLIDRIAAVMHRTKTDIYRHAIREIGDNSVIVPIRNDAMDTFKTNWERQGLGWPCDVLSESKIPGYTNLICYYGSSTYDTKQMSCLIDALVQDAQELGIETKTPQEIASLLSRWGVMNG